MLMMLMHGVRVRLLLPPAPVSASTSASTSAPACAPATAASAASPTAAAAFAAFTIEEEHGCKSFADSFQSTIRFTGRHGGGTAVALSVLNRPD